MTIITKEATFRKSRGFCPKENSVPNSEAVRNSEVYFHERVRPTRGDMMNEIGYLHS